MKQLRAPLTLFLAGLVASLLGATAAEASVTRDASLSAFLTKGTAEPFATAPQLALPSLSQQLQAIDERVSAASECVALCEFAAGIEAHPFGVASAESPNRSEDAWGNYRFTPEITATLGQGNRFGFTGHYWDNEAGLYYAKARFYDPFTARFTQEDDYLGKLDDPPSLHRYFYANGNPGRYWDPEGHAPVDYVVDGVKGLYGLGAGWAEAAYGFVTGSFKLGVKAVELDYKLKFGTLDEKRQALDDVGTMARGAGSHLAENARLLKRGVSNPSEVWDAIAELGPVGLGKSIGGASFETALLFAPGSKGVLVGETKTAATVALVEEGGARANLLANVEASRVMREAGSLSGEGSRFLKYVGRTAPIEEGAAAFAAEQAAIRSRVFGALTESASSRSAGARAGFSRYEAAEASIGESSTFGGGMTRAQWEVADRAARIARNPRSWSSVRRDVWQEVGEFEVANPTGRFSETNVARMLEGLAPRVRAEVTSKGVSSIRDISLELHHRALPQRLGSATAHGVWNLEKAYPWAHAAMDPFRHTGYELVRIIRGTNSF